jgi:indole-3-glycerol phosphate synthase
MNSLSDNLKEKIRQGKIPVIPDIKCRSPKEGDLLRGRDPVQYACGLVKAGAVALSAVTEGEKFGGSPTLLKSITAATGVPVLRKDFITTADQIFETADMGAAAVLLIASMLEEEKLRVLLEAARKAGVEVLVETHSEAEIDFANRLPLSLIGINNRDILRMECDDGTVSQTAVLAGKIKPGPLIISESAISSAKDVKAAVHSGAHAVLVGTALLKAGNAPQLLREMMECR